MSPHPRHELDDAFLTPIRFSLMAALEGNAEPDFGTLRDVLETSDSAVSKALLHLEQRRYVVTRKGYVGTRPRTWVSATDAGRAAFQRHVAALHAIAEGRTAE